MNWSAYAQEGEALMKEAESCDRWVPSGCFWIVADASTQQCSTFSLWGLVSLRSRTSQSPEDSVQSVFVVVLWCIACVQKCLQRPADS